MIILVYPDLFYNYHAHAYVFIIYAILYYALTFICDAIHAIKSYISRRKSFFGF